MRTMYQYPNGLKCAVSKERARAFEAVVPGIAIIVAILGSVQIVAMFLDRTNILWSMAVIPWLCVGWAAVCVAIAFGVFHVWCKPVKQS